MQYYADEHLHLLEASTRGKELIQPVTGPEAVRRLRR